MKSFEACLLPTLCLLLFASFPAFGATVEYDLTIAKKTLHIGGRAAQAMTINDGIPGPTLRFKEGDLAIIHVHNHMDVETSIHWHGILLPNNMDGVPYLTYPPIKPGTTFTYKFPIRQSGTYWYHSHTGLQEQSGVYGSIAIAPHRPRIKTDGDHVILLSDWTNEAPSQVLRTLKRGSEWYPLQKGSAQSIWGAMRIGMLGDYFKRELLRMPPMDISDVAYDRFLANGQPESELAAKHGQTLLLRIINGSATTYFYVEFAGGPLQIIAADGIDVEPVNENRFLIGVAETYDVIMQVPRPGAWEFRATAHDGSGYASVWIGSGNRHPARGVPKPNLYHSMGNISLGKVFALTPSGAMGMPAHRVEKGAFDQPGMIGMEEMEMHDMPGMDKHHHPPGPLHKKKSHEDSGHTSKKALHENAPVQKHAHKDTAIKPHGTHTKGGESHAEGFMENHAADFRLLGADVAASKTLAFDGTPLRPWPPYTRLRATQPTAFHREKPVRSIRLTLDGDMERYVWFFNNKRLSEQDVIRISAGVIVRFIMINRTMMHHPIHLHGHFFRVLNGQGDHAPLKHTVDVAPMSTTVIEFDADEFGDWFFHCHLLYHMKSGMARVIHYNGFEIDAELAAVRPLLYKDSWYFWGEADVLSNMTQGMLTLSNTRNLFSAEWELGWQDIDGIGWETTVSWDRYINRFFSLFIGGNIEGEGGESTEGQAVGGLRYLLPFNIKSSVWVDTRGACRIALDKHVELTPRLSLFGDVEYDTHDGWEGHTGISYILHKNLSLKGQWHSEYGFGAGLQIRF